MITNNNQLNSWFSSCENEGFASLFRVIDVNKIFETVLSLGLSVSFECFTPLNETRSNIPN